MPFPCWSIHNILPQNSSTNLRFLLTNSVTPTNPSITCHLLPTAASTVMVTWHAELEKLIGNQKENRTHFRRLSEATHCHFPVIICKFIPPGPKLHSIEQYKHPGNRRYKKYLQLSETSYCPAKFQICAPEQFIDTPLMKVSFAALPSHSGSPRISGNLLMYQPYRLSL